MALDLSKMFIPTARALPVILLLDASGSMYMSKKIETLNQAVRDLLRALADDTEKNENEYLVTAVAFKLDETDVVLKGCAPSEALVKWRDLQPAGRTPLGKALRLAKSLVEDSEVVPKRSYRPEILLISDGLPTDEWKEAMEDFVNSGRSSKCDRMAVSIGQGNEANKAVLQTFLYGTQNKVEEAGGVGELVNFFQRFTLSVTTRASSANPNVAVPLTAKGYSAALDDIMFD